MILSKYFRTLLSPDKNYYAVFNELHPQPIYLKNTFNSPSDITARVLLEKLGEGAYQKSLIVRDTLEDVNYYESIKRKVIAKLEDPFILYLNLASGCNFSCSYCPVPELAKQHGENFLSVEQARSAILSWYKQRYELGFEKNYIIFYGGEPLLNKHVVEQGLSYISTLKKQIGNLKSLEILMVTNGYLLDHNTIDLCKNHMVTVVFGLDGVQSRQNQTRINLADASSHFKVMDNIRLSQDAGLNIALSMTLTPLNIQQLPSTMTKLAEMEIKHVGFNFLKHADSFTSLNSQANLLEFWKLSSKIAFQVGKEFYGTVTEFQFSKKFEAWTNQDFFPLDCTCLGNQIVVQADGLISNCPFKHRDTEQVGGNILSNQSEWLREFRIGHPLWNPAYVDIPEKALCGQGCSMGSEYPNKVPTIDWASYEYSREAFHDFIWFKENNIIRDAV